MRRGLDGVPSAKVCHASEVARKEKRGVAGAYAGPVRVRGVELACAHEEAGAGRGRGRHARKPFCTERKKERERERMNERQLVLQYDY